MSTFRSTSRRAFLSAAAVSSVAGLPDKLFAAKDSALELCVFNKPLQHMSYAEQADFVAETGFAGIEGTVRKKGHVEPEKVEEDLPKQIEALKKNDLEMTIMTTDVNEADSEIHRRVLKTAAELGVKRFRMGSIKYSPNEPIPDQLGEIARQYRGLADYCAEVGIEPLYQNHSGANRFGAAIWDLCYVLKQFPENHAGMAFDIRHAVVEGGLSWPTEFQLARPFFGAVYCKDFMWKKESKRPLNVPLGTGMVDYPAFFKHLKKSKFSGPVSLHMEYIDHRDPALLKDSIAAIRADRKRMQELIDETGI